MQTVSVTLDRGLECIELLPVSDTHIGDSRADEVLLRRRIEWIAEKPNRYTVLNGDILNNATRGGVSDVYGERLSPMEAVKTACELFSPIKDRILAVTDGNHEARSYKDDGIQLSYFIAAELGIADRYCAEGALIFLRLGEMKNGNKESNGSGKYRQVCYTIYAKHGAGGGIKEGAKVIRLADMASVIDCDCMLHGHTHLPVIMKQGFYRVDVRNDTVNRVEKLFVNTGAYLNYGGYAESKGYKPPSLAAPIITFDGRKKEMTARM